MLTIIDSDKNNCFKSKNEFVNMFVDALNINSNIIKKYNIPTANKCFIDIYYNKNLSMGYYSNNCFYLNIANWSSCKKYEVKSLTYHESYPGHHLQIDISHNFTENKYLATLYHDHFHTFREGWALFSEQLIDNDNLNDYFGVLESETLRIFRIIADIDLHFYGKSPEETIKKMEKYYPHEKNILSAEIHRYLIYPAQPLCYKIGQNIFMAIYNKKKDELQQKGHNVKINDPIMFDLYKKVLINGETDVNELLNSYGIKFYNEL